MKAPSGCREWTVEGPKSILSAVHVLPRENHTGVSYDGAYIPILTTNRPQLQVRKTTNEEGGEKRERLLTRRKTGDRVT